MADQITTMSQEEADAINASAPELQTAQIGSRLKEIIDALNLLLTDTSPDE